MSQNTQRIYRIGIDARFYPKATGGIGRYTRELLHQLAALDRINQYVVFLTEKGATEWDISQPNFVPRVVKAEHFTPAEQTEFLQALNREKFDLVHFLNFNHPVLYTRPFVTTLHDLTMYLYPVGRSQKSIARRAAFIYIMKRALKRARRVIAVSEHSANDAEKYFGVSQAQMEVIYEGAPQPVELPFGSKAMAQEYLGIRAPYFLFLNQWRPHKGLVTLVQAFNAFKKKTGLPHCLVLLGSQRDVTEEAKQAIAQSPYTKDIITPGFAPDELLPVLFAHSSAFINPSEYEGFGLSVLEAFTYGAPVIVANNSAFPEVAGNAALYFPTKDAEALAARMEEIVSDENLVKDLRAKAQAQLRKFSWAKMAAETLRVYLSVLEKKR